MNKNQWIGFAVAFGIMTVLFFIQSSTVSWLFSVSGSSSSEMLLLSNFYKTLTIIFFFLTFAFYNAGRNEKEDKVKK